MGSTGVRAGEDRQECGATESLGGDAGVGGRQRVMIQARREERCVRERFGGCSEMQVRGRQVLLLVLLALPVCLSAAWARSRMGGNGNAPLPRTA